MYYTLYLKSLLLSSAFAPAARQLQGLLRLKHRLQYPELSELLLEDKYLPLILEKLLSRNSNVLDVGSHIGSFLAVANRYAPEGRHIAVEASPSKCKLLKRRFPTAQIEQVAVSDYVGTATFEEDLNMPGFSRLEGSTDPRTGRVARFSVNVSRLDDILNPEQTVDMIKMDVEGGELAALKGAVRIFKTCKPSLVIECSVTGAPREEFYNFITRELSYSIYCFADFLFDKGPLAAEEFHKCGQYPFRAFNFIALPRAA